MSGRSLDDVRQSGYSGGLSDSRFLLFPEALSGEGSVEQALGYVFPPDTRKLLSASTRNDTELPPLFRVPYRWTCSLDVSFDRPYPRGWDRGFARGSGVLVGPRIVLTAGHNICPDGKTSPSSVYVAPARDGRDDPFGRFRVIRYKVFGRKGTAFDYAILTLEEDVANRRYAVLGNRPLGHWGGKHLGKGTILIALRHAYLGGKSVTISGYPGDKCGVNPWKSYPSEVCGQQRLGTGRLGCPEINATTQWVSTGIVGINPKLPGQLLHTADTARGQSGSPLWIRCPDNRLCLIGIHVGPLCNRNGKVIANRAVHITNEVLKAIWQSSSASLSRTLT